MCLTTERFQLHHPSKQLMAAFLPLTSLFTTLTLFPSHPFVRLTVVILPAFIIRSRYELSARKRSSIRSFLFQFNLWVDVLMPAALVGRGRGRDDPLSIMSEEEETQERVAGVAGPPFRDLVAHDWPQTSLASCRLPRTFESIHLLHSTTAFHEKDCCDFDRYSFSVSARFPLGA